MFEIKKPTFLHLAAGVVCGCALWAPKASFAGPVVLADLAADYTEVGAQIGVTDGVLPASGQGTWTFLESTNFDPKVQAAQSVLKFNGRPDGLGGVFDWATGYLSASAPWGVSEASMYGESGIDAGNELYVLGGAPGQFLLIRWTPGAAVSDVEVDLTFQKLTAGGNGLGFYMFVDGFQYPDGIFTVGSTNTSPTVKNLQGITVNQDIFFLIDAVDNSFDGSSFQAVISTIPEPATTALLGMGCLLVASRRRIA